MDNKSIKNKTQKLFIEPLEQRIMLDGAGASTFLDLIDERNQQQITINSSNKDIYKEGDNSNKDIPFTNIARDKIRNDKKNIVFIDSAVEDYETITSSFKENTEFYLINANEDGFKRISEILTDRENIDALHLIGHGSSGQILFGNAFLNNDTIDSYQSTLTSIGQSLTTSGDILFYGCNVASTDQGEILIKKISEITKADIAASDDLTGKGGDWELEKKIGIIETENIKVLGYEDDLYQDGISATSGNMSEYTGTNVTKSNSGSNIMIKLEKQDKSVSSSSYVSQHSITSSQSMSGSGGNSGNGQMSNNSLQTYYQATGETSGTVNSYLVFHSTSGSDAGTVTFDGEIIGIFWDVSYIHSSTSGVTHSSNASTVRSLYTNSGLSYQTSAQAGIVMENNSTGSPYTYTYGSSSNVSSGYDRVAVTSSGGTNNKLHMSVNDGNGGDYIRVIVKQGSDVSSTVEEDGSVSVSNGGSASSPDPVTVDSTSNSASTTPRRMAFSDDGTKLFILDYANDKIDIHNLGTAYDISTQTSSLTDITLASNPHTSAYGIEFSTDGTKMFTSDISTGYVYQWTLTTPWDVSTNQRSASDDLNTRSLFGVTLSGGYYNRDITFSEDGTKLFILGSDKTVHQISLGTAWDLSSYQTPDIENDLSSTLTTCNSISFSPNGKKMFINEIDKKIHEWSLATAWDLSSTVTYEGNFQSGSEINSSNYGEVTWNKDGTKLFILDGVADDVTEYSVSTPFSLANVDQTKSAESISSVSSIRTGQSGGSGTSGSTNTALTGTYGQLTIQSNGSYSYVANQSVTDALDPGDVVYDYFTINGDTDLTITVIGINDTPSADNETNSTDVSTTLNVTDGSSDVLAGDTDDDADASLTVSAIRTGSSEGAGTAGTIGSALTGSYGALTMAADGTYTYVASSSAGTDSFNYTVTDEFGATDIATLTITVNSSNAAPVAANNTGTILEDGTLTVNDGDGANSSGGVTDDGQTADISNEETSVSGLSFNNDGTKMFVSGGQSDTVHEYSLSTAFDVSTKSATANESYSDASNYDWTRGHTWNADGTKLFIIDNDEGESWQKILEHTVQTAFDLSSTVTRTNTYDLVAPSGGSIPTRPKGITFNSDGTKMYIADHATDKIHQFTLSVGFDLTSTVVNSGTLDVSSQNDSPYGVEFSQDGSKVFVVGNGTQGDAVYQYTLNTAWDITSTATYNDSFNLSSQDSVPADIRFNNDGTKMFIAGSNGNEIDEYTLSTPFEIASISGDHDGDVLVDDTDADSGDTLTVTTYSHTSATDEDGSSISSTSSTGTAGTNNVTGYYGTLDLEGDGSYTYTADLTATQALDPGDTVTDVFTYTVDDGNGGTDTATITITVIGVNDTPVAQNDVGVIVEDGTLTVANSANANLSGSYDATGEHSGDVIDTSSSSHTDSDADASASLTVTAIRVGSQVKVQEQQDLLDLL